MNSNVVGPNQIIKVGPMQVDKLIQGLSKAFLTVVLPFSTEILLENLRS